MGMYESLRAQESGTKTNQQGERETKSQVQEQICNFLCEINLLMQDVYVSMYKAVFKRAYESDPAKYARICADRRDRVAAECKKYIMQLFGHTEPGKEQRLLPEVEEVFRYKDLPCLYSEYTKAAGAEDKDGLTRLLICQLVGANDRRIETSILKAMIGYRLSRTEFVGHLDSFFVIADDVCARKYQTLEDLMPKMADCLNQLASWLNVSDVKTLKQSAFYLDQWKEKLVTLISLFSADEDNDDSDADKHNKEIETTMKKDERFNTLFTKAKAYSLIIAFLKLTSKVKLEAATNVLKGNENLGLHAVTFSRELLKVIELSNRVLTIYCRDYPSAKQYPHFVREVIDEC
ncbi:MAG: hypothetical protein P4M11_15785 [Candidatus Pacebacteria bacterium]|nr:hypothetical protein [Candidatus Paceibacterota bacterium]